MRKSGTFFLILLILMFSFFLFKDILIKTAVESVIRVVSGLNIDIGKLDMDISKTYIAMENISVLNPSRFVERKMIEFPYIYIDYDFMPILKGKIHLNEIRINLSEFTIVKNKDGGTNLSYIKKMQEKESRWQKKKSSLPMFQIDTLALKIGKVTLKDYSGEALKISEYNLNIDSTYKNLQNADEIIKIITAKALLNTTIGKLSDFSEIKNIPSKILSGTVEAVYEKVEKGKDMLKGALGEVKNLIKPSLKTIGAGEK